MTRRLSALLSFLACLGTLSIGTALAVDDLDKDAIGVYNAFMKAVYGSRTPDQLREYLTETEIKQIDALKTDREKLARLRVYKAQYVTGAKFYSGEREGDYLKLLGKGYLWKTGHWYPGDVIVTMKSEHNHWKVYARAFNTTSGIGSQISPTAGSGY